MKLEEVEINGDLEEYTIQVIFVYKKININYLDKDNDEDNGKNTFYWHSLAASKGWSGN